MKILDKIKKSKPDINEDDLELIREITNAKNTSKQRAGLVKNTDVGGWDEDNDLKPTNMIHEFKDLTQCVCACHEVGKIDCEKCYDHPKHLENFKRPTL